ncbi:hypothetical protein EVAR_102447_1 [Eumeta japonica]|uniref:Uncharacterized protein n=1 Tax=Eumeta variegata TaxID=151549 RepID=A0A4C1T7J4_EUMVA|nr:hypothetical protein EVAR_102447_1 [Eumeta japonica]
MTKFPDISNRSMIFSNIVDSPERLVLKIPSDIVEHYTRSRRLCGGRAAGAAARHPRERWRRAVLATKIEIHNEVHRDIRDIISVESRGSLETVVDEDQNINFPSEFMISLDVPVTSLLAST